MDNLLELAKGYPIGWEKLWEKEKLLVTSVLQNFNIWSMYVQSFNTIQAKL